MHKVLNAAFDHVNAWAGGGLPAPTSTPLERDANGMLLRHDEKGAPLAAFSSPNTLFRPHSIWATATRAPASAATAATTASTAMTS